MGGEGSYSVDIVGVDGELLAYTGAVLVLDCDPCEYAVYAYFTLEASCPPPTDSCCSLPPPESPLSVAWTAEFFDECDNSMGTASGTMLLWQEDCVPVTGGDSTFETPDFATQYIYCDCIAP
jgi:hypothetical protein